MRASGLTGLLRLGMAGVLSASPALAASPWGGECRDAAAGRLCILSQTLSNTSGDWLATLRLQPQREGAVFQVLVPNGVHLGSGMVYAVDNGPERPLTYRRCLAQGCEALRDLSGSEWNELRRGATLTLVLRPDTGRPPAQLKASLSGISALQREFRQ